MKNVKTERILQFLIAGLLAVFVYVIYNSIHERVVVVGDTAPAFAVKTDSGRTISTSNFGGRLLVLNFWATWCPPCVEEMPSLDQFQRQFANSGVIVLGISVDKDEKAYRSFLNRFKVSIETTRDPENKINSEYGTFKYPETYIINTDGKVVQKIIGKADWTDERMASYIRALLDGRA